MAKHYNDATSNFFETSRLIQVSLSDSADAVAIQKEILNITKDLLSHDIELRVYSEQGFYIDLLARCSENKADELCRKLTAFEGVENIGLYYSLFNSMGGLL